MAASARSERRSGNASVLEEFLAIEDFGSEKVFFESPWVSRALRRRRVKGYQVFRVKQSTTGETPTIFLVAISGTTPASESFFGDWFSSGFLGFRSWNRLKDWVFFFSVKPSEKKKVLLVLH
ncbi:hypothetical protein U1Q18_041410 [Sarracenia purpurea var. burkii]